MAPVSTPKDVRLNLRIKESFKDDLQQLADYLGLTLSSYAHSLLVRAVRDEKLKYPDAFEQEAYQELAPNNAHHLPVVEPGREKKRRQA